MIPAQLDLLDGRRKRRNRRRLSPLEGKEQEALFDWATLARRRYPELEWLFHIPNGGSRPLWEALALKRRGVKAGVPDICLPVARGTYHGLWIELKRLGKGHNTTADQKRVIRALRGYGHRVEVCAGWEAARCVIEDYLDDA
jgi:integrase